MHVTVSELEAYLYDHYKDGGIDESLFMKLVEEIGETAEVMNKKAGRKASGEEDLKEELGSELADVIHYAVAIAALNNIDLNEVILRKDREASVRYHHRTNLEQFVQEQRNTGDPSKEPKKRKVQKDTESYRKLQRGNGCRYR